MPLIIVVEIVTSCEDEYKFPQASRDSFSFIGLSLTSMARLSCGLSQQTFKERENVCVCVFKDCSIEACNLAQQYVEEEFKIMCCGCGF